MTAPINTNTDIKAPSSPGSANRSSVNDVTITDDNKLKGSLFIEAIDGMIRSIQEEADSAADKAVGITFDTIGAISSTVLLVADPLAQVFAAGVGWLMEHLDPIKKILDQFTGNPDAIRANSEDTKAHAAAMRVLAKEQKDYMSNFAGWEGESGNTYRSNMSLLGTELEKMADAAMTKARIIAMVAVIIQIGRDIIRDMVATFIGKLIATVTEAAALGAVTAGIALPFEAGKVVTMVAAFVGKLSAQVAKIVAGLVKVVGQVPKLDAILRTIGKNWERFDDVADVAEIGKAVVDAGKSPDKDVDKALGNADEAAKTKAKNADENTKINDASNKATTAQDGYKSAKDAESAQANEAKAAGDAVTAKGKDVDASSKAAQHAADKVEQAAHDVEAAAKSGDQHAFDEAKHRYEAAKDEFDHAKDKADADRAGLTAAQKTFAKEQQDVADAAANSKQKLDESTTATNDARKASEDYQQKHPVNQDNMTDEQKNTLAASKDAQSDLDTKNATARGDQRTLETANLDLAKKNAAAAAASAKAMETGDKQDIAAAEKANDDAKASGDFAQKASDNAKASGKAAEDSYKHYQHEQGLNDVANAHAQGKLTPDYDPRKHEGDKDYVPAL